MNSGWRRWLHEPLLVFAALALLLFAVEFARQTSSAPASTDRTIVVEAATIEALRERWRNGNGSDPTPAELAAQIESWVMTEILVREAFTRGLEQHDPVIQAHLSQKMRDLLVAREVPDEPDLATLQAFYASHPERYMLAAHVTLRQVFFEGPDAVERAAVARLALDQGADPRALPFVHDTPPGGPVLRARAPERLAETFGTEFAEQVTQLPLDRWEQVPSTLGVHLVRVEARQDGQPIPLEQARDRVRLHWQQQQIEAAADQALRELRAEWTVLGVP
jgi:peptidyl-prolyl cis-trans isomerase C